jgi:hypothetical protein
MRRAAACLMGRAATSAAASTSGAFQPAVAASFRTGAASGAASFAGRAAGSAGSAGNALGSRRLAFPSARACRSSARSRSFASAAGGGGRGAPPPVPRPSARDLRTIFFFNAVPFVAFGFVDNTVLIHAGDAIDASVGVTFGLSSLAAAAMGQIASDTSGVLFGSTIENAALRLGFAAPRLTPEQNVLRVTRVASTAGKVLGVITGCSLGLVNLLFVDTLAVEKAKEEKEYTAIFRAIMHRGHEVAECAAAALWIVDYENRTLWTRAAHGNKKSDVTVRRPFGVGIVGAVAESGQLSNVSEAYAHPRFDRTVDKDGITGFTSRSLLTAPVFGHDGRVVAVVQLVNKNPKPSTDEFTVSSKNVNGSGFYKKTSAGPYVPFPAGTDAADSAPDVPDDDASHWDEGWVPAKVTRRVEREIARARRTKWWRRVFGRRRVGFDESDEKLIRLICHHVSVSLAAMEHKLPTE